MGGFEGWRRLIRVRGKVIEENDGSRGGGGGIKH